MISGGRKKILEVFFKEPRGEYYLRELARDTKIPVNNAHKYLHEFLNKGFLKVRKKEKKTFFRVNLQNEFLLKIFEYFELERTNNFFKENQGLLHLKEITRNILGVVGEGAIIIYDGVNHDIRVVAPYEKGGVPLTKVIKTSSLEDFRERMKEGKFFEEVFRNRVVLYNEFLFWKEIKTWDNYI